ncbi:type VI secretion protein ImpB, partial [Enterococcus faecium]|nr:type VI secretion protein ImpB [Enterococcus faecium]EKK0904281.1 type VI secretion protein ImpB [Enterococcus faecium]
MMDYSKEPVNDYFLIDMKSFYASVECIERNLDPLTTELVVMSRSDNTGSGLILASSPEAKKRYGITNVSRPRDLPQPFPKTLHVVPPRMNLYIKRNMQVNNIFRRYVADEDLLIYSIDESILKVTRSLNLFTTEGTRSQRRKKLAQMIQERIKEELGLIATVGVGDNPLLAKLALDNEAKHNEGFIAEWTYENVPEKVWNIPEMTDFWGIGSRMKKRLNQMGIMSIRDLANWNPYTIKSRLGVIGLQLY